MAMSVQIILASYLIQEESKMPTEVIAPIIPLEIDEETGSYRIHAVADITKVVDQNLKMILLTRPGERITLPDFGVGLSRYLFELKSQIQLGTSTLPPIRENIISQISTFLRYITITNLEINFSKDESVMQIKISYFINDSAIASTFDLTLSETLENLPV